ncbi:MAG: DUF4097 family beta strand repeat-containing protein, partial [Bryobacteraceae bacterium]
LIGPLLLIVIGALFLASNVRPDLPILRLVAEYWPFLLIGWGAVRLLEILYIWMRGRPLPVSGVTGGEWVLIVFVTVVGTSLYTGYKFRNNWPNVRINSRAMEEFFGETYEFPLTASWKAGKAPKIVVENHRGNTRILAADGEEIQVTGRSTIRAFDQGQADKTNKECPLEILTQGDKILIRTNQDRASSDMRVSADLEISVPRGAGVEARGRSGDFDITDMAGDVEINSDSASVRLQNIGGSVRCDLRRSDVVRAVNVKGGIELKGRGEDVEFENVGGEVVMNFPYTGEMVFRKLAKPLKLTTNLTDLRVEALPGYVRMTRGEFTGSEVTGPVRLVTKSTDVHLSDFTHSLELNVDRGDIELRPAAKPLPRIDVRAGSGNLEISLPESEKFQLTARTRRGDVRNDFGPLLSVEEEGRGGVIRGGSGTPVTLETSRGSLTVSKASLRTTSPDPAKSLAEPPQATKQPRAPITLEREKQ